MAKKKSVPTKKAKQNKIHIVMEEFKEGKLRSGSENGPKVTNPKQAIAIAISESKKKSKMPSLPKATVGNRRRSK